MEEKRNELQQFIYKICYSAIWQAVNEYLYSHPASLNLSMCRIHYPDFAFLKSMILEYTTNISIDEDNLNFDAVLSCVLELQEDNPYNGIQTTELPQWLIVSCTATITDKLDSLSVSTIKPWEKEKKSTPSGIAASNNIVPILHKKDLEAEAARFLEKYFPEALVTPMPVPIEKIAENDLHLTILQGHCITSDFSILGEICFSSGKVKLQDLFKCSEQEVSIKRGTILIDACTYWQRNQGTINNTIAHEVYHWYRHRLYAAIKQLVRGESFIAHRCPIDISYPASAEEWTDEQRMEWQANNMAPRILMPIQTFQRKVRELYDQYNYANSDFKIAVLTNIADELADFYAVSRQSALIRMTETGFPEAATVLQSVSNGSFHTCLTREDAFFVYSNNADIRNLVDSGLFAYIEGYFIINNPQYIDRDESGNCTISTYAWFHLEECVLRFSSILIKQAESSKHLPNVIMHRANAGQKLPTFDAKQNELVISAATQKKREEFEKQKNMRTIMFGESKTCWQAMYEIIQFRKLSKSHFCALTELGEEVYRKAEKNISTAPSIRTIVSFARGLNLDLQQTEKLLQLAGRSFDDSDEHQALKFCITGFSGQSISECNNFLMSYGYQPLGTQQRL